MTVSTKRLTFAEYLAYEDEADVRYELVSGELIPMSLGTALHGDIDEDTYLRLKAEIERLQLPWVVKHMTVGVQSPRGGAWQTLRIPDVTVLPVEQWHTLRQQAAVITLDQSPPLLVIEVVSQSTQVTDIALSVLNMLR